MSISDKKQWIEIVDENDQVVGIELRAVVHARGLRHRAVHIIVKDCEGRILIQKRSILKTRHPRKWDTSAAGHVDPGESYEEAATRELHEELGIPPELVKLNKCFKLAPSEQTEHEFIWVYECMWDKGINPNKDEIEQIQWIESQTLQQWINSSPEDFTPAFVYIWEQYYKTLKHQP